MASSTTIKRGEGDGGEKVLRERNKSLRGIFEEEGLQYGAADVRDPEELAKRANKALNLRKANIYGLMQQMRNAKHLDLCFLVDATGSMGPHLDAVRSQIRAIVDRLMPKDTIGYGGKTTMQTQTQIVQKIRLAFVGYRDFGNENEKQFQVLDFTESVDEFYRFCEGVQPVRNQDDAEDVFGGLEKTIALRWSTDGSTRMLFHIADAPCHGKGFHNLPVGNEYDRFRGGDPLHRSLPTFLKKLADNDIKYHFGRITEHTDKMVAQFNKLYRERGGDELVVCDLKDAQMLMETVVSTTSIAVAGAGGGGAAKKQRFVPARGFAKSAPKDWTCVSRLYGTLLAYEPPKSILHIKTHGALGLKPKPETNAVIQIANRPFAGGVERHAYYARYLRVAQQSKTAAGVDKENSEEQQQKAGGDEDENDDSKTTETNTSEQQQQNSVESKDVVLKRFTHKTGYITEPAVYESAIQVQTIAAYLAEIFGAKLVEKKIEMGDYSVCFLKGLLFSCKFHKTTVCWTAERRYPLDSVFLRFSNNQDYSMLEQTAEEKGVPLGFVEQLMAFSHWTYQASNGYLMVVDLQGIVNHAEKRIELTDPAIHCTDLMRFGRTNLGVPGMQSFFRCHRCNEICEKLGLTPVFDVEQSKNDKKKMKGEK